MRLLALHSPRSMRLAAVALFSAATFAGCGLDEVAIPELDGPSALGQDLRMTASPDVVVADGFSTVLVTATLRNQNGAVVSGRDIFFYIADESGRAADIGLFRSSNGPGTGITARTNSQGVVQVVYESPVRSDATANQSVLIAARPIGDDFAGALYRTVRIELRSAEPRLFPQNPTNMAPLCNFAVETPNGLRTNVSILFQSTASDPDGTIVRYEWDFGNGVHADHPDVNASYRSPGSYTVTHRVTDDDGAQKTCAASITIF